MINQYFYNKTLSMKKFFWHLLLSSILWAILFFLIKYFVWNYDYNWTLQIFRNENNIYIMISFLIGILFYMLWQYKSEYKIIDLIQKFLFFILFGGIMFGSLHILVEIKQYFAIIITLIFLISVIFLFIKSSVLHFLAWLLLFFDICLVAVLIFPTYPKTPNIESIFAHQNNILAINNTKKKSDFFDWENNIAVSCFFWKDKIDFGSLDFKQNDWYVKLPISKNTKCRSNVALTMISRNGNIYNIETWSFQLQEERNFENIDESIFNINYIKNQTWQILKLQEKKIEEIENKYYLDIYKKEFQKTAKNLFSRVFTDKKNLEIMEYYKLFILNDWLKEFLTYRLLIWKDTFENKTRTKTQLLGNNFKDRIKYIFVHKKDKRNFENMGSKTAVKELKKWYNWLWKTKFLKKLEF